MKDISEFAATPKGIALFAISRWEFYRQEEARASDDGERMIYTGRCYAYTEIVRLLTGRAPDDPVALDVIDAMPGDGATR